MTLPVLRERWLFLLAALGSLAISVPRVCRELALMGDSAELTAAAHAWGVPRAPGYALWTLLGHAAAKLPLGAAAFRVNLTSALYHALAVGFVALVAQRLSRSLAGGLVALLVLALSKSFLLGSLYAEVFPLCDALFALGLWLALRAGEAPLEGRRGWLVGLAVCAGLALGHHEVGWLGLPAVAVCVARPLSSALRARPALGAELALALCVPFALSLLLPLGRAQSHPLVSSTDVGSASGLWHTFLRSEYGGLFGLARALPREPAAERVGALALLLFQSLGPVALAAALVGAFALLRERRDACVGLLLAVALPGLGFAANYRFGVESETELAAFERFTTLTHLPLAALAGAGAAALMRRLPVPEPRRPLVALLAAVVPSLPQVTTAAAVDLSGDRSGGAMARDLLRGVPDGALVLLSGDLYTGAGLYACAVERQCQRVRLVAPGLLANAWRRRQHERLYPDVPLPEGRMVLARSHELVASELPKRPVFVVPGLLARDAELRQRFQFTSQGLLAKVHPDEAGAAADQPRVVALASALAGGRDCEGCALDPASVYRPSQHVRVLLEYSALLENASRLLARAGAEQPARELRVRYMAIDAAVGAQLSVAPQAR